MANVVIEVFGKLTKGGDHVELHSWQKHQRCSKAACTSNYKQNCSVT